MTMIPILRPGLTGVRRSCLGGCLLGVGLLIAPVQAGHAGIPAPAHLTVPVGHLLTAAEGQDPGRSETAATPAVATPGPDTSEPIVAVGFGWG